jgi:hypothetical protein
MNVKVTDLQPGMDVIGVVRESRNPLANTFSGTVESVAFVGYGFAVVTWDRGTSQRIHVAHTVNVAATYAHA